MPQNETFIISRDLPVGRWTQGLLSGAIILALMNWLVLAPPHSTQMTCARTPADPQPDCSFTYRYLLKPAIVETFSNLQSVELQKRPRGRDRGADHFSILLISPTGEKREVFHDADNPGKFNRQLKAFLDSSAPSITLASNRYGEIMGFGFLGLITFAGAIVLLCTPFSTYKLSKQRQQLVEQSWSNWKRHERRENWAEITKVELVSATFEQSTTEQIVISIEYMKGNSYPVTLQKKYFDEALAQTTLKLLRSHLPHPNDTDGND